MTLKKKKQNSKKPEAEYAVGVDLGGTNIVLVLITYKGKVVRTERMETEAAKGPDFIIDNMAEKINGIIRSAGIKKQNVKRMGIGVPGPLDSKKGIVRLAPNMPGWKDIKLKQKIEKKTGIKTAVENDANCAVYGEKWTGAAKGAADVVGLTLGTGVGGGIILNNRLHRGNSGTAGEIGHTIIDINGKKCSCGASGCIEAYASATAIAESAKEKIREKRQSMIVQIAKGDMNKITSKTVYEALLNKDKVALEVWDDFIRHLSASLAGILNTLNPEVVVIAGGVINAGNRLFTPLRKETGKKAFAAPFSDAVIVPAKLGELAGAIGAAGAAINEGDYYGL
ncbi:MAG: ROK family protein [Candidatus Goldiibacteriota bacterium]